MSKRILGLLRENLVFLIALTALAGGYFALRTQSTPVDSLGEFDALISAGKPTVVEFYSNT